MPEIVLKNVCKRWGDFIAVDNLNMVIKDRGFVTLLGPSGCGKTTTLRMIAGLETPTSGQITIGGKIVFDSEAGINLSPAARNVGFLFQNYALWPHMTVYKNIAFGLENLKWSKDKIDARIKEICEMLKIGEFLGRYPSELSGGQQQRVAIARTLAPSPTVLFMDEPLSNLDAKLRLEMRTELKRLHQDTNSTFVYVTHDQLEAMTLATEVCLMKNGVLQQYAPPLTVYSKPANTFIADFVGNPAINLITVPAKQDSKKSIKFKLAGKDVTFISKEDFKLEGNEVILGIRPEFVKISKDGIKGKVYSSLPAGMETTVKVEVEGQIITSVIFGIIDFKVNETINFDFDGCVISLFDAKSTARIADGELKISK